MTACLPASRTAPVQLTLDLRAPSSRCRRSEELRPFWQYIDNADLGGDLRARRPGVRALLAAESGPDGCWIGYCDLVIGRGGCSGTTRPHSTRVDALASAAHSLAKYCDSVLVQNGSAAKSDAAVARHLLRWLQQLDLL